MNDSLKWLDDLGDVFTSLLNTEHDQETLDTDAPYCPDPLTCGGSATDISDLSNRSIINTRKRKPIQNPLMTAEHSVNVQDDFEMSQRVPLTKKQKLAGFGLSGVEEVAIEVTARTGEFGY